MIARRRPSPARPPASLLRSQDAQGILAGQVNGSGKTFEKPTIIHFSHANTCSRICERGRS